MEEKRIFLVALRGFLQEDILVIHRICQLSRARPRGYQLIKGIGHDILLANASTVRPGDLAMNHTPVVWIGGEAEEARPYHVERPIISSRLLRVLDQATIRDLHYIPEINIGVTSVHDRESLTRDGQAQWSFQPDQQEDEETGAQSQAKSKYRILVADDSQVVRTQLHLILDNLGLAADYAEDGSQALTLLRKRHYDLILMDVVMPNMDGLEATKKVKKELEGQGPVILLTAKTSHLDRLRGAFAGCDTYLTKPLNQQDLVRVLAEHLEMGKNGPNWAQTLPPTRDPVAS